MTQLVTFVTCRVTRLSPTLRLPRISPQLSYLCLRLSSVSVINSPPDINLFQLLRVSPGQNKHPGDRSVSECQASCVSPLRRLDSRLKGLLFMTCVTSTFRRDLNVVQRLFSLRYFCFSLAASQEVEV